MRKKYLHLDCVKKALKIKIESETIDFMYILHLSLYIFINSYHRKYNSIHLKYMRMCPCMLFGICYVSYVVNDMNMHLPKYLINIYMLFSFATRI